MPALCLWNPVTGPSWWSPPPRRCSHLDHSLTPWFEFLRLQKSQACRRTEIFIFIPVVKIELEHWTGPTMVDIFYVMLVCVTSLSVFIVKCL